jgi:hypothetical protein
MKYLSSMTDDQTLVMYSGHPMGLFPSSPAAPRLVITNGMVNTGRHLFFGLIKQYVLYKQYHMYYIIIYKQYHLSQRCPCITELSVSNRVLVIGCTYNKLARKLQVDSLTRHPLHHSFTHYIVSRFSFLYHQ